MWGGNKIAGERRKEKKKKEKEKEKKKKEKRKRKKEKKSPLQLNNSVDQEYVYEASA